MLAEFQNIPSFKGPDGKYDPSTARIAAAAERHLRARSLRSDTRSQLLINQLQQGIGGSYFLTQAPNSSACSTSRTKSAKCSTRCSPADKFAGNEPVDDAAIKAYYDKNGDRFMTTESVALEFAELRLEQVATQVAPTEADLQ